MTNRAGVAGASGTLTDNEGGHAYLLRKAAGHTSKKKQVGKYTCCRKPMLKVTSSCHAHTRHAHMRACAHTRRLEEESPDY